MRGSGTEPLAGASKENAAQTCHQAHGHPTAAFQWVWKTFQISSAQDLGAPKAHLRVSFLSLTPANSKSRPSLSRDFVTAAHSLFLKRDATLARASALLSRPGFPSALHALSPVRGAGGPCVVTLLRPSDVGDLASVEGRRRVTVLTGTPHGLMTSTTACDQGQARRELGSSLTRLARGSRLSAPPSPLEPRNPLLCRDLRARGHGGDVPCSLPGVSDSARWPSGCHAATMVSACWFCTWASLRRVSLAYVPQEVLPDCPQPALHR